MKTSLSFVLFAVGFFADAPPIPPSPMLLRYRTTVKLVISMAIMVHRNTPLMRARLPPLVIPARSRSTQRL